MYDGNHMYDLIDTTKEVHSLISQNGKTYFAQYSLRYGVYDVFVNESSFVGSSRSYLGALAIAEKDLVNQ